MRIAWLSALCLVACTGPGLEPPNSEGRAGAGMMSTGGGGGAGTAGGAGAGGFDNAGSGGAAGLGSGGENSGGAGGMATGGLGGVGGTLSGGSGGQGGIVDPLDAGASDGEVPDDCATVPVEGRCDGEVFESCSADGGVLERIDCAELGMTCRAEAGDAAALSNGCVDGDP
jgi:hypothetical protein